MKKLLNHTLILSCFINLWGTSNSYAGNCQGNCNNNKNNEDKYIKFYEKPTIQKQKTDKTHKEDEKFNWEELKIDADGKKIEFKRKEDTNLRNFFSNAGSHQLLSKFELFFLDINNVVSKYNNYKLENEAHQGFNVNINFNIYDRVKEKIYKKVKQKILNDYNVLLPKGYSGMVDNIIKNNNVIQKEIEAIQSESAELINLLKAIITGFEIRFTLADYTEEGIRDLVKNLLRFEGNTYSLLAEKDSFGMENYIKKEVNKLITIYPQETKQVKELLEGIRYILINNGKTALMYRQEGDLEFEKIAGLTISYGTKKGITNKFYSIVYTKDLSQMLKKNEKGCSFVTNSLLQFNPAKANKQGRYTILVPTQNKENINIEISEDELKKNFEWEVNEHECFYVFTTDAKVAWVEKDPYSKAPIPLFVFDDLKLYNHFEDIIADGKMNFIKKNTDKKTIEIRKFERIPVTTDNIKDLLK